MSKDSKRTHDMSVEEILKSIKGVINERKNLNHSTTDRADDKDILELTDIMNEPLDNIEGQHEADPDYEESLLSTKSASEATSILKNFADKVRDKHLDSVTSNASQHASSHRENILEELMIEMLRPALKQWLDENLPSIVKDLVEREIKKLMPAGDKKYNKKQ